MSEYIVTDEWMREYESNIEELLGVSIEYDGHHNPTPPLRPIVLCRDCVHFTPRGTHRFANGEVNEAYCEYVRAYRLRVTPDGFCAWGERWREE